MDCELDGKQIKAFFLCHPVCRLTVAHPPGNLVFMRLTQLNFILPLPPSKKLHWLIVICHIVCMNDVKCLPFAQPRPLQYLYAAGLCAHADRDTLLRRRDMLVRASNIIHHGFDCQSNDAHSASSYSLQPRNRSADRLLVPANMRPLCTITEGSEARWMLANASRGNSSIALTGSRSSSAALDPFVMALEQVLAQMVGQAMFDHLKALDRQALWYAYVGVFRHCG